MRATIPVNTLRAALLHVPKKDHRQKLLGVTIERSERAVTIMGTDGHTLFAQWFDADPGPLPSAVIVPRAAVEAVLKLGRGADNVRIDGERLFAGTADIAFDSLGAPIDWRRAWPADTASAADPLPGIWDWSLLARAQESLGIAQGLAPARARSLRVGVRSNGPDGPALVCAPGIENAAVLVMPLTRAHAAPETLVPHVAPPDAP